MGYVVEREGRWYAVGYEGLHPTTGADRRRWHRASDEQSARLVAATLPGRPRRDTGFGLTLARFVRTRWLPAKQPTLKPSTFYRYQAMSEAYLLPHLGRVPLRAMTSVQLERLYAHLLSAGAKDGGPLAPKTVLNVHQIVRKALADAERKGLVVRNVALVVDPPRVTASPEQRCWDEAQLRRFLRKAEEHRLLPALWLAAMTGMRRGEVLGLRWSDVDLDGARLAVRRTASCAGYKVHITTNKTATSRRAVDLDAQTVDVLREWRAQQTLEAHAPSELVFTNKRGALVHPHVLSQSFERVTRAAELPRIRFHDLRHTHATLLLKAGVPLKVVSERLGHSTPAFTMAVYQHVPPGMQRAAADLFAQLITGDEAGDEGAVVAVAGR
jgi:integrase